MAISIKGVIYELQAPAEQYIRDLEEGAKIAVPAEPVVVQVPAPVDPAAEALAKQKKHDLVAFLTDAFKVYEADEAKLAEFVGQVWQKLD